MNVLHVYSCPDHPFLGSPPFSSLPAIKLHESSSTEWLACDCLEPKYPALFFFFNTPSQRCLALVHREVTGNFLKHRLTPPQRLVPLDWSTAQVLMQANLRHGSWAHPGVRSGCLCVVSASPNGATFHTCLPEAARRLLWWWGLGNAFTLFPKSAVGQSHPVGNGYTLGWQLF